MEFFRKLQQNNIIAAYLFGQKIQNTMELNKPPVKKHIVNPEKLAAIPTTEPTTTPHLQTLFKARAEQAELSVVAQLDHTYKATPKDIERIARIKELIEHTDFNKQHMSLYYRLAPYLAEQLGKNSMLNYQLALDATTLLRCCLGGCDYYLYQAQLDPEIAEFFNRPELAYLWDERLQQNKEYSHLANPTENSSFKQWKDSYRQHQLNLWKQEDKKGTTNSCNYDHMKI